MRTTELRRQVSGVFVVASALLVLPLVANAGDLDPSAPPGPTMKTLDEVEPRTLISSLPFTISQSGSYYLTASLTGSSGQDGITIDADEVTLDLNGFSLVGVTGSLDGITVTATKKNITIKDGSVTDWGGSGINAGVATNSLLKDIHVSDNGGNYGIHAGGSNTVINCTAYNNATYGLYTQSGCVVQGCTAQSNDYEGIKVGQGSTVMGCTASGNTSHGIVLGTGCAVTDCTANGNSGEGISARYGSGSTVRECTVSMNRSSGISLGDNCRAVGNNCVANGFQEGTGAGIVTSGRGNCIEANSVVGNDTGILVSGLFVIDNIIIKNTASKNPGTGPLANYDVGAGNTVGQILNFVGGGTITSGNPWANFEF